MKGERLKFPQIASLLYEEQLDLEEWRPQVEQRIGLGIWTFWRIKKIAGGHLKEFSLLLAKANGLKLNKDDESAYKKYIKFFLEMSVVLGNAKRGTI